MDLSTLSDYEIDNLIKKKSSTKDLSTIPDDELDKMIQAKSPKPFVGDLLPKFSTSANIGEQTTITPQDIVSGTVPLKGMRAIQMGLADRLKETTSVNKLSDEPIMKQTGLLPTNAVNIGANIGAKAATPRNIVGGAIDIAAQPETYVGLEGLRPGILSKPLQGLDTGISKATEPLQGLKNLTRGGVSKEEAMRISEQYGNSNAGLVDSIKIKLGNKLDEANQLYKTAINGFKGNIESSKFYQSIQKGLRNRGWVDMTGNPTNRFKSGLDPVMDKLTNLYIDMQNPERMGGQIMSNADFSTYRDALGSMLKEKPSDILVMKARNALYDSAESSGMKGIKNARDLEKEAYSMESKFLNSKTGDLKVATEGKLSTIGTDKQLSKQELDHIKELEDYIGHPISKDATTINKLNKATATGKSIKEIAKNALLTGSILEGGRKIITGRF